MKILKTLSLILPLLFLFACSGGDSDRSNQDTAPPDKTVETSTEDELVIIEEAEESAVAEVVETEVMAEEAEPVVQAEEVEVPSDELTQTQIEESVAVSEEPVSEESVAISEESASVVEDLPATQDTTIQINFIESAPKDRFVIQNSGTCTLDEASVTIDLIDSNGKLIFDTTGAGAGVEVFQPFEIAEGQLELISSEEVIDGDTALTVRIQSLQPGSQVGFTIDVDDTLTDSELGMIRVTGSEISGGLVMVSTAGQISASATFGDDSAASVSLACA
ncbi:MAG: hypothetical protein AAGD96_13605 [Chloroflexota bacterium]